MRSHIEGLSELLLPLGRKVYFVEVPKTPTYPYFLIWSTTGRLRADSLDGAQTTINDLIGITSVGQTPESALELSRLSRDMLLGKAPQVAGRHVHPLRLHDAREVQPDRDVTLPGTNRHPSFGVDIYRLISEPA